MVQDSLENLSDAAFSMIPDKHLLLFVPFEKQELVQLSEAGGGGVVEGEAEHPGTAAALWGKRHTRLRSRKHQPTSERARLFFHLSITPPS